MANLVWLQSKKGFSLGWGLLISNKSILVKFEVGHQWNGNHPVFQAYSPLD